MHHAQRDCGAGFCLVNDLVIALRPLQSENRIPSARVMAGGCGRSSRRVYTQFLEWALLDRMGA
jgi:acetoin utilization deacetylase AcuC-like enzyme